jgi:cell wall assembly regulator SMI1
MENLWNQIEDWLRLNALRVLDDLLPGINVSGIRILEEKIGFELPEDFKTSLEIHNGQDGRFRLLSQWEIIPVDGILLEIDQMQEVFENSADTAIETRGAVKDNLWNSAWIPFASDGSGNFLCIDMDPPENGIKGQIILWASDPPYVEVVSQSYRDWLAQFLNDLEAGRYIWDDKNSEWSRV